MMEGYFVDLEEKVDNGEMTRREAKEIYEKRLRNLGRNPEYRSKEDLKQIKRDEWLCAM